MKTSTKILAGLLVIAMMTVLLASCGGSKSIVGKWESGSMTYEFKADGTYVSEMMGVTHEGTYEIKNGKLSMDGLGNLDFKVKGDTLSFSVAGYGMMEFKKVG